jgi:homoserine kinase
LEIGLQNGIPLGAGLHLEAALTLGGIIAANNLVGGDLGRDDIIELAAQMGVPRVVALSALLGGLNLCLTTPDGAHLHQSLEPPPLRTIILVPQLNDYQPHIPDPVAHEALLYNMARLPFLMQALLNGDWALLDTILPDPLYEPALSAPIPGYQAAKEAARQAGASLTIASNGPSFLIFAAYNHALVLEAVREALTNAGVQHSRHWTVSLDSQGVTVSLLG